MPDPIVHHLELCVFNAEETLARLRRYGFVLFAKQKKTVSWGKQLVVKLGPVLMLITERNPRYSSKDIGDKTLPTSPTLCCSNSDAHTVDSVYNLAFSVKKSDVATISERIFNHGGEIIEAPTEMADEDGTVSYSIVKSNCGNVMHTLLNKDDYHGLFLPGFEVVENNESDVLSSNDLGICGIDHVTFAVYSGNSGRVIEFYEKCFNMNRFQISNMDDEDNGLIISDGVGLRLRAMEYWRCAETGLSYKKNDNRENAFMLVVVESLPGQKNCNVEAFLKHHRNEGIEHVALKTHTIVETVSKLKSRGVSFRNPPTAYYDELRRHKKISVLGEDINKLSELGILLDNEEDPEEHENTDKKKYLMQIFAKPLFDLKTFFIEVIQRSGAKGLGSGNILALVRSIREEERRNMLKNEATKHEITKESITSPRQC